MRNWKRCGELVLFSSQRSYLTTHRENRARIVLPCTVGNRYPIAVDDVLAINERHLS